MSHVVHHTDTSDEPSPAYQRMLQRCIAYLEQSGFGQRSLREIAQGVGTSHRMLIYHFGSREGLLAAVVADIESRQRDLLASLAEHADEGGDLAAVSRTFWRHLSDPALAPAERLFFEIYAHALHDPDWSDRFRAAVIAAWDAPLIALFRRYGYTRAQAARRARLSLAVARGLLLDLLLTGDRRLVTGAADIFAELITAPPP
jgi:AcrR family transcriptional regulator